jgi:hypothetical protein
MKKLYKGMLLPETGGPEGLKKSELPRHKKGGDMSMRKNLYCRIIVAVFAVLFFYSSVLLADDTTIVGEVDDQYQIIGTDGEIYTVVDNAVGRQIVTEHISDIVKITCTFDYSEENGLFAITAKRFQIMNSDYAHELEYDNDSDYDAEYEE